MSRNTNRLIELLEPASTAVLWMEMQRGVVGDLSPIAALCEAASSRGTLECVTRLLRAARKAGVQIVFCNAIHRSDRKGSAVNAPGLAFAARTPGHLSEGSPSAEHVPELAAEPGDFISARYHGLSPFTGTGLDAALRRMRIRSVIATGVSLNVGIIGICVEAVGLGYSAVVAREAVAGVPAEYGDSVLQYSLPVAALVTSIEEIVRVWESQPAGQGLAASSVR